MFFSRLFWHQQNENIGHRFAIRSIERNRRFEVSISNLYFLEILDAGVGNGNAFTEAGRADPLPVSKTGRYPGLRHGMLALHEPTDRFKKLGFA